MTSQAATAACIRFSLHLAAQVCPQHKAFFAIYIRHSQKHRMIVDSVVHKVNVFEFLKTEFKSYNRDVYN